MTALTVCLSLSFAWIAAAIVGLSLCRAAAEGDRAMPPPWDDLERLYATPDRYCPACGAWLAGDGIWCGAECQGAWLA